MPSVSASYSWPREKLSVRSCARNQDDLLFGVRAALENHDVNRLAEFYHWTGMSNSAGYQVMDRLSRFSDRPLVDVQLTSSRQQGDDASYADPAKARDELGWTAERDVAQMCADVWRYQTTAK